MNSFLENYVHLDYVLVMLRLICLLYYLISLSYRSTFLRNYNYSRQSAFVIVIDYLVDCFYIIDFISHLNFKRNNIAPTTVINQPQQPLLVRRRGTVTLINSPALKDLKQTKSSSFSFAIVFNQITIVVKYAVDIAMMFPFEVLGYAAGLKSYQYLRLFRALRCVHLNQYWSDCSEMLRETKLITTITSLRVVFIVLVSLLIIHVSACIYYAIGLSLWEKHQHNWLSEDHLATEGESPELLYDASYRYVLSLYWSVQTFYSVEYGDMTVSAQSETWYKIFYIYVALGFNYLSVAALIIVIKTNDASRTRNLHNVEIFDHFAKYRKLPDSLVHQVHAYYLYQWEALEGVDENQILSELPANLSQQVLHSVVREVLLQVDVFKDLNRTLVNAISERAEPCIYSPDDVIVHPDVDAPGCFVVSSGEVMAMRGDKCKYWQRGQMFCNEALFQTYQSRDKYVAKTFVEVFLIRNSVYQYLSKIYVTSEEMVAHANRFCSFESIQQGVSSMPRSRAPLQPKRQKLSIFRRATLEFISSKEVLSTSGLKTLIPNAVARLSWDCLILACMLFYAVSCGLLLASCMRERFFDHYFSLLVCSYVVDLLFLLDVIMRATVFGFKNQGLIITNSDLILAKFIQTQNLVACFLSIFPLDIIMALSLSDIRILPVIRLLKLIHLMRITFYVENFIYTLRLKFGIVLSFAVNRFLQLYICLFFLCHWMACIYQLAADVSVKVFNYNISWRIADMSSEVYAVDYAALSHTAFYVRALYSVISTMSSISSPDIIPTNLVELLTIIFIIIIGVLMFNTLLSALVSLMEGFDVLEREYNAKIDKFREFVAWKGLPHEIESRVLRYYEYHWTKCKGVNESAVLKNLPKSLRYSVSKFLVGPLLEKLPFFSSCSESLKQYLLVLFMPRVFLPDDPLMICGEQGREMFIIEKGQVAITSADRQVTFATLTDGDYIGESCLLKASARSASVYAMGYVDTYFITRDSFQRIAFKFPVEYDMIIENIEASLKSKMVANEKQLHDKDATAKPDNTSTLLLKQSSLPSIATATSSMGDVIITEPAIQRIRRCVWIFMTKHVKDMNGGTINPASNFKLVWDVIVLASLAFYAVVNPMLFVMTRANISPVLFFMGYLFDAINWVDSYFYSTKFATYYNGHLLSTSDEIRSQYFKTGRMYIDLLSEFPYDLIMWAFVSRHMIYVIRLVKLLKLVLLPSYIEQLEAVRAKLHISNFMFRFVGISFIIVMIPYWVSIIFYAIAKTGQSADGCDDAPDNVISCSYRRTWIYQQMVIGKLPYDISDFEWSVLMRSFSWSISALTARMSDVRVVNAYECLFAFLVLFLGLVLNGKVIGNIMGIVIDANEGNTSINKNIDILRSYLRSNKVPIPQIDKAVSFMRYRKTKQGSLTLAQDLILRDLPVTVQKQIDVHTKVGPYLRGCPIFDICSDEFLREISAKLRVQLYIKDDKLIDAGDIGYEMFFIEDGSVHVVSADGRTIYSTLEKGSFFGETALFTNANRTASIKVASSFCIVYILTKDDFHDELASSGIDAKLLEENFQSLQAANKKRNAAVTSNLSKAADPSCKLYRFLGGEETQKLTYLDYLRLRLPPNCYFRIIWNFLGMCFLLYYSLSIVFYMAFTFGSKVEYYVHHILWFDCLVDAYWVVDIILKALIFPFKVNMLQDQIITDGDAIWHHYKSSGHFYIDVIASIPLEFLNLILGVNKFRFSTRLIHLIRVPHLIEYFDLFEQHVEMILGWTASHTSLLMVKAGVLFLVVDHWLACGFFSIHRYLERHQIETYVTMDHSHICHYDYATGTHDICSGPLSFCYVRSIFFVLSPFREITPWQNSEYLYQIFVTIIGAFLTAFCVSVCELYLQNNDDTGMAVYDRKIKEIEKYCQYRALKPELQETILTQYNYNWLTFKSTRTNRMDLLDQLSPSFKIDITSLLQKNFIARTPIINHSSDSLRRKISSFVRPQISIAGSYLFRSGSVGSSLWFVSSGVYSVSMSYKMNDYDLFTTLAFKVLLYKQKLHGKKYTSGDHFGETSLLSKSGIRPHDVLAITNGEVYTLSKEDLWEVFLYCSVEERRSFIHRLFISIGGKKYLRHTLMPADSSSGGGADDKDDVVLHEKDANNDKIQSMFRMSNRIMFDLDQYLTDDDSWRDMIANYKDGLEDENILTFNLLMRLNDSSKISTESHRERLHSLEQSAIISRKVTMSKDKVYRYNSSNFARHSSLRVSLQRSSILFNDSAEDIGGEDESDEEGEHHHQNSATTRVDDHDDDDDASVADDDDDPGEKPSANGIISDGCKSIGQQVATTFIANLVDRITDKSSADDNINKRMRSIDRGSMVRFNSKNIMFRENSKTVDSFCYDDTEEISLTNRSEGRRSRTQSADQSSQLSSEEDSFSHSSTAAGGGEDHVDALRLPEFTSRKYSSDK